jgi:hypothetical protein
MNKKLLEKILDYFDNKVKTSCENEIVDYQITLKLSKRSYFDIEDIFNNFPNHRKNNIKEVIDFIEKKTVEDIKNIGKTFYRKYELKKERKNYEIRS